MKVSPDLFTRFVWWLNTTEFPVLPRTGEKTLQNQFALFLHGIKPANMQVELEVNTKGLLTAPKKLTKREIDVFWEAPTGRHAVELKFCRDPGSYNIGIFNFLEDIRFGEQLLTEGFASFGALFFTDIPKHFTQPTKALRPKNQENTALLERFRKERKLYGEIKIKTGKLNSSVKLTGSYDLQWHDLNRTVKYTFVCMAHP